METELEYLLTHSHKPEMIKYVNKHPECFKELLSLVLCDKQPYSWRAGWLLWSVLDPNDNRIIKYIAKLIKAIPGKKDGQQRELLKIIQLLKIPQKLEGTLFNLCIALWINSQNSPSLRYNAFKILLSISKNYPELQNELKTYSDSFYLDSLTPGAKHSINLMINKSLKSI